MIQQIADDFAHTCDNIIICFLSKNMNHSLFLFLNDTSLITYAMYPKKPNAGKYSKVTSMVATHELLEKHES